MRKNIHVLSRACLSAATIFGVLAALPAVAGTVPIPANPPTSACVTTATKKTHAGVIAQLDKDVAPYLKNAAAQKAIQTYRDVLEEAWTAMTLPYCGFGSYGNASAIKSYTKTTSRARTAFVGAIPSFKGGAILATVPAVTPPPAVPPPAVVPTPAPAPTPTPAPKPAPVVHPATAVAAKIAMHVSAGLSFGMRSDDVLVMQKVLVAHFGLPSDDSHVTGYFGSVTQSLVLKFQLEKKIVTSSDDGGAGLVGPRTAAALSAL